MSLAAAFRDGRRVVEVLRGRPCAVEVGRLAGLTGIEERRLRRLLAALVQAGDVFSTPGLPGADGRTRGRRYFVPASDGRTDSSATTCTAARRA